jgi:SAM-dependent methyltransferase
VSSYQGVQRILRYNGRFFALSLALAGLLLWTALARRLPDWAAPPALLLASATLALTASSLLVSHYVYDRSALAGWSWLLPQLVAPPRRWAALHAGLDEATPALRRLFPGAAGVALDVFDAREMPEPSIAVARRLEPRPEPAAASSPFALPLPDRSCDLVVLYFVAHELRRPDSRERFFDELARVLSRGGTLLLVEHTRDAANAAAFGPGALHFLPRGEWLRLARRSRLDLKSEITITPFVRAFFLARSA